MKAKRAKPKDFDDYVAGFPSPVQKLLRTMRATIRKAVPDAGEKIGYGIPTFTLEGNLVHFAAFNKHIGFFPGSSGIRAFKGQLSAYKGAKGSVQFPFDEPLPLGIVTRIVKFRVKENLENAEQKRRKTRKIKTK